MADAIRLFDGDTEGLSPKAVLAAVLPSLGGVVAVGIQWFATGEFDRAELATAVGAVVASLLAFLGAWAGSTGTVKHTRGLEVGPASDELLGDLEHRKTVLGE